MFRISVRADFAWKMYPVELREKVREHLRGLDGEGLTYEQFEWYSELALLAGVDLGDSFWEKMEESVWKGTGEWVWDEQVMRKDTEKLVEWCKGEWTKCLRLSWEGDEEPEFIKPFLHRRPAEMGTVDKLFDRLFSIL